MILVYIQFKTIYYKQEKGNHYGTENEGNAQQTSSQNTTTTIHCAMVTYNNDDLNSGEQMKEDALLMKNKMNTYLVYVNISNR